MAVAAVFLGLALVPALALLGQGRAAVLWLAVGILALSMVRLQRPNGSWIAARGRGFDVAFGVALAIIIFLLAPYANLPAMQ
ncbi:DUF3017 domain-containing protein [Actinomyces slackii]|uniref:DUF3017 domain-containing protein n=2 Tax=Actinomyces slackii TaxID=52774 RepID=A0A448KCN5_9ACTO|nr:Uncharacterised protein [Actinomyces slackii]